MSVEKPISQFLCDTWWYGMTQRISDQKFKELAQLRAKQGFTAVQLVVGIPPEVGPENTNASSIVGPAWNLKGEFNQEYLNHSRERVKILNSLGLTTIVYGGWGQQIEWLGEKKMKDWWKAIVKTVDDLNVMYCITGESDIWIGQENQLLPDKSTDELKTVRLLPFIHPKIIHMAKRTINIINNQFKDAKVNSRHKKWSNVLSTVSSLTNKPLFIHVLPNTTSNNSVNNPELLSAITVQTGHSSDTRKLLWKLPLEIIQTKLQINFINLEPWYEGITDKFGKEDQLYAYWASMMAGAAAYCYGAHGIWNAGDGNFLSHWGKQTLDEAIKLTSPQLIGLSHNLFVNSKFHQYRNVEVEDRNGELIKITRSDKAGNFVCYIPDITFVQNIPHGKTFLPVEGKFIKTLPEKGQVVIISS